MSDRVAPQFIHLQQPVPGWLNAAARLPERAVVKAVAVQWLAEAKARNPKIRTNLRYVNDTVQWVNPGDTEAVREQRAREWFDAFLDGTFWNQSTAGVAHKDAVDSIAWWNEYYGWSQTAAEKELWWRQERAAARVFHNEYLPRFGGRRVRLSIAAAPVGNDIPWQTAQTAVMYDCIVDYHGYDKFLAQDTRDPLSWQYHSGRWDTMDTQFRAAGFTVDWWHGEWGPYMDVLSGYVQAFSSEENFLAALRTEIMEIRSTRAYQAGRFWATPALFTTGGGERWTGYNVDSEALLIKIADIFKELWVPVQAPPPPPPPPPVEVRTWEKHVILVGQNITRAQYDMVVDSAWAGRNEITFSADAAFARPPNATKHSVEVVDPGAWGGQTNLLNWVNQHYVYTPATVITWRELPASAGGFPIPFLAD